MVKCTDVGKLENIETHLTQQLEEGKYDGFSFIYTFTHLKQKKYNHQVRKYQCTWDPSKKALNKKQRMKIYENIC